MRGQASLLDAEGKVLWTRSMNRYADPDDVEKTLDADRGAARAGQGNEHGLVGTGGQERADWERPCRSFRAPLTAAAPLTKSCEGSPFGTYLVEWKHRRTAGSPLLSLEISELEYAADATARPSRARR